MRMRLIAPLAMAATAAAIGFAPIASALPTGTSTDTGGSTLYQSPGNAQITAQPGPAAQEAAQQQYPFFGYPLYGGGLIFHHGGHH